MCPAPAAGTQGAKTIVAGHLLAMRDLTIEGGIGVAPFPIVRGIDLELRRGEVLGIIGESGAGKSTIGLAALGMVRPGCRLAGGTVAFDGIDLFRVDPSRGRRIRGTRIAYVAQSAAASFNPAHRLLKQTVEGARAHGLMSAAAAAAKAVSLYRLLRLPEPDRFGERFPHQVSGGQLQRAMIAMAMMTDPDLIVFDEPTTALDVTTQIEVLASIKELVSSRDLSAIYVTHDLALVAQVAQRIMVLRHGAVVETAQTRTMLRAPREAYTRSLWAVRQLDKPAASPAGPLLRLSGVHASYGQRPVLHDIELELPRRHTVAVVGESGSGKSTLARVIAGILPPTSGRVALNGTELAGSFRQRSARELRRIQLVHQSPDTALNPRHTVREILGRPLALFDRLRGRVLEQRVLELLDMVGLDRKYMQRRPGELSGGEKQRIAISRALAASPEIILCDEITSALDQIVQREVIDLLLALQRRLDITYVFITHDFATVRAIADEVVVMHRGRIVEKGSKRQVFSPPHEPYTELLLSSVPEMDPTWLDGILARRRADSEAHRTSLV